jgi:hypothetical protein
MLFPFVLIALFFLPLSWKKILNNRQFLEKCQIILLIIVKAKYSIQSNVAALSGKELPPVNNVDFDKCLVVRTDIAEDKDKVHIVNKFDEQLINLYDASLVAKVQKI